MEFNEKNTQILVVNYNTPDYIIEQYKSIRKYIGDDISINIVDNSDKKISKRGKKIEVLNKDLYDIPNKDINFKIFKIGKNIHHGPGMDYGINQIKTDYILILDSDICILHNLLEIFKNNYKSNFNCMGLLMYVDKTGHKTNKKNGIKYIHPSVMLIDRDKYLNNEKKFKKHGAPCIDYMVNVNDNELVDIKNIRDYVEYRGRGTVSLYGINL